MVYKLNLTQTHIIVVLYSVPISPLLPKAKIVSGEAFISFILRCGMRVLSILRNERNEGRERIESSVYKTASEALRM